MLKTGRILGHIVRLDRVLGQIKKTIEFAAVNVDQEGDIDMYDQMTEDMIDFSQGISSACWQTLFDEQWE